MVAKDEVVDDGGENYRERAPQEEKGRCIQPRNHILFDLFAKSTQKDARRDEKGDCCHCREEGEDDQTVADVRVADVDKLERHDVIAVMRDTWLGHPEAVHVQNCSSNRK